MEINKTNRIFAEKEMRKHSACYQYYLLTTTAKLPSIEQERFRRLHIDNS